ncbi:hypothetical protein F5Y13DRAFT_150032 [Hypoxylon sp. FL1857]|nr:hypothetical protein F5Y13DRAFT_150032 [Hypoxylon sp. FL1857]
MPGLGESTAPSPRLYFAYGSNLWLKQMATRCPSSWYVGRAVLPDYRWQINERGFANIVPASGFAVHGLVYELGADDEPRLDRSEGVPSGAYTKAYKPVILHTAPAALRLSTRRLVEGGDPARRESISTRGPDAYLQPNVLVYLSENYVQDGRARDEYVDRMNSGIRDGISMGIPRDFFENAVRKSIPNRPALRKVNQQVNRHSRTTSQTPIIITPRRAQSAEGRRPAWPSESYTSWGVWQQRYQAPRYGQRSPGYHY